MAFADLTQAEQDNLQTADRFIRGLLRTITGSIDLEMDWWTTVIDPIMAQLVNGDVIEQSDGLAGSQPLTKADLQAIKDWLNTDVAVKIETNKTLVVKSIGINAG